MTDMKLKAEIVLTEPVVPGIEESSSHRIKYLDAKALIEGKAVIVPKEPTEEMIQRGAGEWPVESKDAEAINGLTPDKRTDRECVRDIFKAMLGERKE